MFWKEVREKGVKKNQKWTQCKQSGGQCVKERWQENHFVAMLKGSMKAAVIYRRGWRKNSDGGVAKTPFRNWGKTISRNRGPDVQSKPHTTPCWNLCLLSSVIALLLNGSFSLFGPGNSIAKWLLLETSTRKLRMAATALVIVMNARVFGRWWYNAIYIDCHSSFDTDLLYWFKHSNVFVAEMRNTQSTLRQSFLCFASFCTMLSWLQTRKRDLCCWSEMVFFLLDIYFSWMDA